MNPYKLEPNKQTILSHNVGLWYYKGWPEPTVVDDKIPAQHLLNCRLVTMLELVKEEPDVDDVAYNDGDSDSYDGNDNDN